MAISFDEAMDNFRLSKEIDRDTRLLEETIDSFLRGTFYDGTVEQRRLDHTFEYSLRPEAYERILTTYRNLGWTVVWDQARKHPYLDFTPPKKSSPAPAQDPWYAFWR